MCYNENVDVALKSTGTLVGGSVVGSIGDDGL